jgi:alkylation response protein AidB-like acyl-CoA dehydrogenase
VNTFLSSAQEAVMEQYRAFAAKAVGPISSKLETHQVCLKEFLQNVGQKGYLGLSVSREYGGQGLPFLNSVLFAEALSEQEAGLGLTLATHFAVIETIKKYGTDTQKSRYLPLLARGELFATLAFSEEQAGTDFTAVEAELVETGTSLNYNGKKHGVITGDFAGLLLALTKNLSSEKDPLALALVDGGQKTRINIGPDKTRLGMRSAYINDLEFKGVAVAKDALLVSNADSTEAMANYALDVAKVVVAATACGMMRTAVDIAVDYANKREQFGKPIGQFQGIQWKLADMETERSASLLQVYRAAWSLDEEPESFSTNAAMCKWFAGKMARFHSGEALQVLGSYGLGDGTMIEKIYRDAKATEIYLGTSEAQKVQLTKLLKI